ncbi:MAG: hypothetical protein ABIT10_06455 [Alteraurantiacibacter sp.]
MRFSWLLVPLVAATVGWRLLLATEVQAEDEQRMLADVSAVLAERGFASQVDVRDGPDAVLATRAGCSLAVVAGMPSTGGIELFERRYGAGRRVLQFYQDRFVTQPPRWRMAWTYYAQRHLSPYGFDLSYHPLVLVAADPACDPAAIDWARDWARLRFHGLPPPAR